MLAQAFKGKNIISGTRPLFKTQAHVLLLLRSFYYFHALQGFFTALGGTDAFFAVKGTVLRNNLLLPGNFLLLFLISFKVYLLCLFSLLPVLRIIPGIVIQTAVFYFGDACAYFIKQITVV